LDKAKSENVEIITGGKVNIQDRYIDPTIIRNVSQKSVLMEDEIFGPILPILTTDSVEDAVDFVNSREKPLACYMFSANKAHREYVITHSTAGSTVVNDTLVQNTNNNLPFGGIGPSGTGSYHGEYSFRNFSHEKAVMERPTMLDAPVRYPPYTDSKLSQLKFLRKIPFNPRQLMYGFGALFILAIAMFGTTAYGKHNMVVPIKSVVISTLQTLLKFLE